MKISRIFIPTHPPIRLIWNYPASIFILLRLWNDWKCSAVLALISLCLDSSKEDFIQLYQKCIWVLSLELELCSLLKLTSVLLWIFCHLFFFLVLGHLFWFTEEGVFHIGTSIFLEHFGNFLRSLFWIILWCFIGQVLSSLTFDLLQVRKYQQRREVQILLHLFYAKLQVFSELNESTRMKVI